MTYALVLLGCALAVVPLEVVLRVGVLRQWRRLLLTLVPVAAAFLTWDALAVRAGHWSFGDTLGPYVGSLPVEEVAFFLVVPTCAVLALEAVRRVRR